MSDNLGNKKRVPITKLEVGDFVEEVSKQLGKVKVVQTGIVRNYFALQALKKKGVIEVIVDPSRSKKDATNETPIRATKTRFESPLKEAFAWQKQAHFLFEESLQRASTGLPIDLLSLNNLAKEALAITSIHLDTLAAVVRTQHDNTTLSSHLMRVGVSLAQYCVINRYTEQASIEVIYAGLLSRLGYHLLPKQFNLPTEKLAPLAQHKKQSHIELLFKLLALSGKPSEHVCKLLAQQNELLDGTGYPEKLDSDKLNSAQRLLAIALEFDSLHFGFDKTSAMGSTRAFRELMDRAPAHYDPDILQAFIQAVGVYPAGTIVRLESGRIALVIERSSNKTQPRVKAFYNGDFNHHISAKTFELTESDDAIESTTKPQRHKVTIDSLITAEGL